MHAIPPCCGSSAYTKHSLLQAAPKTALRRQHMPAVSAEPMVFFSSSFSWRSTSSGESLRSARAATCRAARPADRKRRRQVGGGGRAGRRVAPPPPRSKNIYRRGGGSACGGQACRQLRAEALQQQRPGFLTLLGWLGGQRHRSHRSLASERMALLQQGGLPHFRLNTTPVSVVAAPLESLLWFRQQLGAGLGCRRQGSRCAASWPAGGGFCGAAGRMRRSSQSDRETAIVWRHRHGPAACCGRCCRQLSMSQAPLLGKAHSWPFLDCTRAFDATNYIRGMTTAVGQQARVAATLLPPPPPVPDVL